ncbi:50S ribosomal protein L25 [Synergistaceae bacterium OttesenSCG-928-D05]|nr:50S ribosomal protein L25 [Synergistaceae bacterium OttesenSCG-928-D05]
MAAKIKSQKFDFEVRTTTGKNANRKLRGNKKLPAVLYGPDFKEGLVGTIDAKAIAPIANGSHRESTVVELVTDGKSCEALIRDVQRHPLTQQILHLDFYQIVRGQKLKVEIPVVVLNKEMSPGIKEGGLLDQPTRTIMIEVLPKDIPSEITVDLKDMQLGAEVFVRDLPLPEGAEWVGDADALVLKIAQTRAHALETEGEEGEENAEVEVVAKGKKEED